MPLVSVRLPFIHRATVVLLSLALAMSAVGLAPASAQEPGSSVCRLDGPLAGTPSAGLTNMGFETGDVSGWAQGVVTDAVGVTGADDFTSPWEGEHMAVLGTPAASADVGQPPGPNEICQDFVVTEPTEEFIYNVFTYDYSGYDEFRFDLRVTDPATGVVLASHSQGAWGTGTALKTTGWQGVRLDLAGRQGQTLRLTISAGGTSDEGYPLWTYVDSSDERDLPAVEGPVATASSTSGSVMVDPVTGQLTLAMPYADVTPVTVSKDLAHPDGAAITSAVLLYGGVPFLFAPVSEGSTVYSGTISAEAVSVSPGGTVAIQVTYADGPTQVIFIGTIVLYAPSGVVSDAVTGQPVVGADVFLHRVEGWEPDELVAGDGDCRTVNTRDGDDWSGMPDAAADLGTLVSAASVEITPNVNPFVTNGAGYYGWGAARGCWYVLVQAVGYETRVSPVVGVPPEVFDLDLALTPLAEEDTTPPAWPADATLTVSDLSQATLTLTWTEAADDTAVTGYRVLQDGTEIAEVSAATTTLAVAGLTAATAYTFAVQAHDAAGNQSIDGPTAAPTTPPVTDTTPPAWPADATLTASNITQTRVDLSWPAANDNVAVTRYHVYRGAQLVADLDGAPPPTSHTVTGLVPGTTHTFTVQAHDATGNETTDGPSTTVRTAAVDILPESACPAGVVPTAPFTDIAGNVHAANIACIVWYQLTEGTTPTTYSPANRVTRDQMASFIARLMERSGVAFAAPTDQGFTDIAGNEHADQINQLAAVGVVLGTNMTTYGPRQQVRRDQMASFLVRAYEVINNGQALERQATPFTDVAGNTHRASIMKAATAGFALGTSATTYAPAAAVRRDQMGSFLARVLDRGMADGHVTHGG